MQLTGKKLGLLLSVAPNHPNFQHGLRLAEAAVRRGVHVYLYCIDEAVRGLEDPQLQELKAQGVNLFACAYGAQNRGVAISDLAAFSGLTVVSDLLASTDRFIALN
jgi:sulfur relay (sulfurtransferase) complex TusBCD TusD component (DsrE family)